MRDYPVSSDLYPWLESNWNSLIKQYFSERLPHAMLWITPSGIGTETLALQFLQLLMCSSVQNNKACGECNHCQLFEANTHPDFHYLSLEESSKVIKIEQVRALIDKLLERPHQGGKRLVFVEPADLLHRSASNAFLKTLEEPGDDTYILLITSRPEALPATIRSRCQVTHFKAPTELLAQEYVEQHSSEPKDKIRQVVKLAQNRPLLAIDLLDSGQFQARTDFFSYLQSVTRGNMDPVALAGNFKSAEEVVLACDWLYSLVTDAEKTLSGINSENLSNSDQHELISLLTAQSNERRKLWLDKLNEAKRTMLRGTNVNPVLTMEALMTSWIAFSGN